MEHDNDLGKCIGQGNDRHAGPVRARGRDGRISKVDAQKLLSLIKDSNGYTHLEKETMAHIRKHYIWTDEAEERFRNQVRSWVASV